MLKISILLPDLRCGGAERVSIYLAHAFNKIGHSVEFVLMNAHGEFLYEVAEIYSVVDLRSARIRKVPYSLSFYLKNNLPDILIANMWPLTTAAVLGRFFSGHNCKLLLVEHSMLSHQYKSNGFFHRVAMRHSLRLNEIFSDCYAGVSQGVAFDLEKIGGLPPDSISVLYNPVPGYSYSDFSNLSEIDDLWGCPKGNRFLSIGSLKPEKNLALLICAFSQIKNINAKLMLVGCGDEEHSLRNLSVELGVESHVIFAGFHSDVSPFYSSADVYVMSSNYEGLPTVLIEALNYGLTIVSTDCPSGPSEILENGRLGYLVPVGDVLALSSAMKKALNEKFDPIELKRRANDFSPSISAKKYLHVLGFDS